MKINHRFIGVLVTSCLLLSFAGCTKSKINIHSESENGSIQNVVDDSNWNKEEVNGLLKYIPSDSSIVLVSTRNFDNDNPVRMNFFKKLGEVMPHLGKVFEVLIFWYSYEEDDPYLPEDLKNDKAKLEGFKTLVEYLKVKRENTLAWIKDPNAKATEYGFNAKHIDVATYFYKNHYVLKFSVDDGNKLKLMLEKLLSARPEQAKLIDSRKFNLSNVEVDNEKWSILTILSENMEWKPAPIWGRFAVNFTKDLVTVVPLGLDDNLDGYNDYLKPAETAVDKSAFGTISNKAVLMGYLDYGSHIKDLMRSPYINSKNEYNIDISDACISEISDIYSRIPKATFVTELDNDNKIIHRINHELKDNELLNKVRDLHTDSLAISNDNSILSLVFNLNIDKTIKYLLEYLTALGEKDYQCASLKLIKMLPKLLEVKDVKFALDIINKITGVNISLNTINLKNIMKSMGFINVTGTSMDSVIDALSPKIYNEIPEIAKIKKDAETPTEIKINNKYIWNAYLTSSDFVAASNNTDLKSVLAGERKTSSVFLKMTATSEAFAHFFKMNNLEYRDVGNAPPDMRMEYAIETVYKSLFDSFDDTNVTVSFGTDDKGLVYSMETTF